MRKRQDRAECMEYEEQMERGEVMGYGKEVEYLILACCGPQVRITM